MAENLMSGPPVRTFIEGWALPFMSWGKAHYFKRSEAGLVRSLCGQMEGFAGRMFQPGNWRRCKICERKAANG